MVRIEFGFPPVEEQKRIVDEVERRLSVIDEIENQVMQNLQRAERLRQAVLRSAYEGALVPQNSHDEPANVLLERIRSARAAEKAPNKTPIPGRRKKESLHAG